ncbi:tRNA (adenosine(37)-N6)-dimethylallyltransferase MiaA [Psychrobacter jeotgali]|uniref:tRNA (adenosine(37)-N6)-dimethylallyltransferase MiaA n=1 Tax=Psychrobacter jeotgali TaxID=179010 RepID=UPI00191917B2|nr:tRNA (adenosine(37)-N6)-dimethylallyltransferase MiaA [Psychrobacter jeotgali]
MHSSSVLSSHKLQDNSVVCLMAPTASGKTALAYELYDTGRYELISVDSALIYRDMNIGTAKPTAAELERYPHHLVNIIDPTQSYSVAEFVSDVERLIDKCHQKGKIPLLIGGTMMYYMALLEGLSPVPDSDANVREQVEQWRQTDGIDTLYDYLAKVDPISHARLKATDSQRITRAVEVYLQTQIPISKWQQQPKRALAHNPKQQWHALVVMPERAWLHERIAQRLDIMWNEGLVGEVIGLLERYTLTPDMPAMRCVGYRQVLEYLVQINHPIFEQPHVNKQKFYDAFNSSANSNDPLVVSAQKERLAYQKMQDKSLYATRQLAKRQYTWLRKLTKLVDSELPTSLAPSDLSDDEGYNIKVSSLTTMTQAEEYLL